jgi:hypothetical protein
MVAISLVCNRKTGGVLRRERGLLIDRDDPTPEPGRRDEITKDARDELAFRARLALPKPEVRQRVKNVVMLSADQCNER